MNLISSDKDVLFVFRAQLLEEGKKIIEIKKGAKKQRKIIQKRNAQAGSEVKQIYQSSKSQKQKKNKKYFDKWQRPASAEEVEKAKSLAWK